MEVSGDAFASADYIGLSWRQSHDECGPTSRGYFDYRAEAALQVYADWMKYNSRSIYGCTMAEPGLVAPDGCKYTQSAIASGYMYICTSTHSVT